VLAKEPGAEVTTPTIDGLGAGAHPGDHCPWDIEIAREVRTALSRRQ
jgi:hypothetical protein